MSILNDVLEFISKLVLEFSRLVFVFFFLHDDYLYGNFKEVYACEFRVGFDPSKYIVLNVPKIEKIDEIEYPIVGFRKIYLIFVGQLMKI